jgi:hypothetical protein
MKIVGFAQLRNELEKGNLENWFKCMSVCDYIYIFDQNSTDGSQEYYKKFDNVSVIESKENRFSEELGRQLETAGFTFMEKYQLTLIPKGK